MAGHKKEPDPAAVSGTLEIVADVIERCHNGKWDADKMRSSATLVRPGVPLDDILKAIEELEQKKRIYQATISVEDSEVIRRTDQTAEKYPSLIGEHVILAPEALETMGRESVPEELVLRGVNTWRDHHSRVPFPIPELGAWAQEGLLLILGPAFRHMLDRRPGFPVLIRQILKLT